MNRVAVTTTADSASRYLEPLRHHGLVPVELPCIRIEPSPPHVLERLRVAATAADGILLTSARAVRIVWHGRSMPKTPAYVVGSATAEAVEAAGGRVALTGSGGAASLVDTIVAAHARRVVFPHARAADPENVVRLRRAGFEVAAAPAYDTVPIAPDPEPEVDAVIFGSPSALEGWASVRTIEDLVVGVMGPVTGAAVRRLGVEPHAQPERPDLDSLVGLVADRLTERSVR